MFESLSTRLQGITERLRGKAKVTEADLDVALRDIRLALLEADVNFKVVKEFVARVRERAIGIGILTGLNPGQQIIKIVHEELVAMLGSERYHLRLDARPAVLMVVGLQGSGKTTTAAKLAVRLRREGKRPLLVAADVYRPAAVDQLVHLGDQNGVEVHTRPVGTPALEIARSGYEAARGRGVDVMILDTAGRLHVDEAMMDELVRIVGIVSPSETLLVVHAMTGQEAVGARTSAVTVRVTVASVSSISTPSAGAVAPEFSLSPPRPCCAEAFFWETARRMCSPGGLPVGIVMVAETCPSEVVRTVGISAAEPSQWSWIHSRCGKPWPITVSWPPEIATPAVVSDAELPATMG